MSYLVVLMMPDNVTHWKTELKEDLNEAKELAYDWAMSRNLVTVIRDTTIPIKYGFENIVHSVLPWIERQKPTCQECIEVLPGHKQWCSHKGEKTDENT